MAGSDVQLMLDAKAGDEQSFALLLHRYRSPLVNFLYRMVRNREQAEDLAQEVFIRVYRAREEYVPSAKFTTWLFRIATNLALNSLRDNRYQRMEISLDAPITVDAEDGDEKTIDVAEKHPNIEQHLVEEARKKMIRHAIDKLRSEEHTSELQSRVDLVCRLLLEKKTQKMLAIRQTVNYYSPCYIAQATMPPTLSYVSSHGARGNHAGRTSAATVPAVSAYHGQRG